MKQPPSSIDPLPGAGTVSVDLPKDLANMLQKQARAHRKPVAAYLREWLEDQADAREATRRWKDIQSGKTKTIPAEEVYKRLGI